MRTDLHHLPENKLVELQRIVKIMLEEFEDATKLGLAKTNKMGRILKIALFGSYARGDWVNDRKSGYASHSDLLIVVNHEEPTNLATYWSRADIYLMREVTATGRLTLPGNFIVPTLAKRIETLGTAVAAVCRLQPSGRPAHAATSRDGAPRRS